MIRTLLAPLVGREMVIFSTRMSASSHIREKVLVLSMRRYLSSASNIATTMTANHLDGRTDQRQMRRQQYNVGFVGLGHMGLPMALNLAKHSSLNVSVVAFDINQAARQQAQTLSSGTIQVVDSVPEIILSNKSPHLDAIFTMLTDDAAVNAVMTQLLDAASAVATQRQSARVDDSSSPPPQRCALVDCSTVSPATTRKWHAEWQSLSSARRDVYYEMMDAPVSGGVTGATAGTLTFMVGHQSNESAGGNGNTESASGSVLDDIVQPLLLCMGRNVLVCGGPGTGAATKLCNNLALAAQMVGISEALHLGEALGVDPVRLTNVMNVSTAACWSSQGSHTPHPAVAMAAAAAAATAESMAPSGRNYSGGFGARLMLKDLKLALEAAASASTGTNTNPSDPTVELPLTSLTKDLYEAISDQGHGNKDFSIVLQHLKNKLSDY